MSTAVQSLPPESLAPSASLTDSDVRANVWSVLGALYPRGDLIERRWEQRYPYPYLIHLTPVGADGVSPDGDGVVVVGKHLSEQGLGFYHPKPLPNRRMIATLESANGNRLSFLIDLTWCRFTRQGWYESGGRFVDVAPSPAE